MQPLNVETRGSVMESPVLVMVYGDGAGVIEYEVAGVGHMNAYGVVAKKPMASPGWMYSNSLKGGLSRVKREWSL